ncbi:MAG: hypothetical protein M1816_005560 [Peltula sp. TS41687]|nr:MAG: hypothetical protein M1816_005560 [Peltula sp. TS41687]
MRVGRISLLQDHYRLSQPSPLRIFTRSYGRRKKVDLQETTASKDDSKVETPGPADRTTAAAINWLSKKPPSSTQAHLSSRSRLSRINIVNTELCRDAIARLAPTLGRHTNCDIVELNCGVGYWSEALHEHLQPRSHILVNVDDDEETHLPFLRPLLDRPGSRYHYFPSPHLDMRVIDRLIHAGFLANHQRFELNDPRRDLPNDSLLLVANLAHVRARSSEYTQCALLMYMLIQHARIYAELQAYGRVRMLIWINDSEKKLILPRTIVGRRKFSVQADVALEHAFEIAGLDEHTETARQGRRERTIDLSRSVEVTRGMLQRGITTPPDRKPHLQKQAEAMIEGKVQSEDASAGIKRPWHAELEDLEQRFREGAFSCWQTDGSSGEQPTRQKGKTRVNTPEYHRLRALRNLARRNAVIRAEFIDRVDKSPEHADVNTQSQSADATLRPNSTTSDFKPSTEPTINLDDLSPISRMAAETYQDDRLAAEMKPPLLLWDRRIDEPLMVQESDFYPRQGLSLLDLHPKPGLPALAIPELRETHQYIFNRLFSNPRHSVVQAIESLAPGAFEALSPQVPALRDSAKGGHSDLSQRRARLLTAEMAEGLFFAWQSWPLRWSGKEVLLMGDEVEPDWSVKMGTQFRIGGT